MIFRAIFWLSLVSVLMPHEPDLGLGRPGAGTASLASSLTSWAVSGLSRPGNVCDGAAAGCAGGLAFLGKVQGGTDRSLADVRSEIEASIKARREKL